MRVISGFILAFLVLAASVAAQVPDSVISVDDIVFALKLKKKGVFPFAIKPGVSITEIKTSMGAVEVFKQDSTFITYTLYFSNDKYDFGDVTFDLLNGNATDASIETYFAKKEQAVKALNLIKANFDKLYKPGSYSDHILQWKYAKKGTYLWIQMSQIEFEGDNGFVIDFLTSEPE